MKLDLFTKILLSAIAGLLTVNLLTNTKFFTGKSVEASSSNTFEVGKFYNFVKDFESIGSGKVIGFDDNGWVKVVGTMPNAPKEMTFFINTQKATTAFEWEKQSK